MRKQRTTVTEKTFNAAKIMLAGGATQVEISDFLKIAPSVLYRMKVADSWEEYKQTLAAIAIKQKNKRAAEKREEKPQEQPKQEAPVVEHRQTVTIQATHYMMEELRKQNELLTLISNKLAFIVDELTK